MVDFRFGPVELYLVSLDGDRPAPAVIAALTDLVAAGTVNLLDFVVVSKAEDGTVTAIEIEEHADEYGVADLEFAALSVTGQEDIDEFAELIEPGTSAAGLRRGAPRCRCRQCRHAVLRVGAAGCRGHSPPAADEGGRAQRARGARRQRAAAAAVGGDRRGRAGCARGGPAAHSAGRLRPVPRLLRGERTATTTCASSALLEWAYAYAELSRAGYDAFVAARG
ncbi:hypothetical protein JOD60_000729 [Microbacterium aurum]|nr:hypothetical protein [Microbacterium aurum]